MRMAVLRTILLQASKSKWLRERIPRFRFSRRAVARFMPGEHVDQALKAAQGFQPAGIGTVITYLGENIHDAEEARDVTNHYCDVFSRIEAGGLAVGVGQWGRDFDDVL